MASFVSDSSFYDRCPSLMYYIIGCLDEMMIK